MKTLKLLTTNLSIFLIAITAEASKTPEASVFADSDSITYKIGDQVLWTYNHAIEEGKPYFHPLANAQGTVFTDLRPDDHPWHRGMWFSWKYINGVNYWEEDRITGLSKGRTKIDSIDRDVSEDKTVTIELSLVYSPSAGAAPVMREHRTIVIHPPKKDASYSIDWASEFQAIGQDILLDRTPLAHEPNGKVWGGYAGLSLRMSQALKEGLYRNSGDQTGDAAKSKDARWVSYTPPAASTVVFMDHPSNLRYPSKWYISPGMNYLSPAVLHDSSFTLPEGETLSLKYRVHLSSKALSKKETDSLWLHWTKKKTKVLLISGQNNHNWRETTPVLKSLLTSSESIEVSVNYSPQKLTTTDLTDFDVIVSNWNTYASKHVKEPISEWNEEAKSAYVNFVRNGGGHIVIHAGSTSFHDWDDYFAISLMRWGLGGTSHGKQHEFPVRLDDPSHPVLRNFNPQMHFDELWRNVEVHPDAIVLASSYSGESGGTQKWEPSVFIGRFGKGRCFATTLGHDAVILESPQLQTLITQAVLWAKGE